MPSPAQIRAARALLDWTLADLSARVGVAVTNLGKIERGESSPHQRTIQRIQTVFSAAGIEFTADDGVKRALSAVTVIDAPLEDIYIEVLTNALQSLQAGDEMLIFNADGALSSPEVVMVQQQLIAKGIAIKFLAKPGSLRRHADQSLYRDLPTHTPSMTFQVVFDQTVLTRLQNGGRTVIIRDQTFADAQRELFMMIWNHVQ